MKITVRELIDAKKSIEKVLAKDLPFKLSYRLSKIAKKLMSEFKLIEKTRNEIIKKFGAKNKEGQIGIKEGSSGMVKFKEAWKEFGGEELTLSVDKIPQECLELMELSAFDIAILFDFIEEIKPEKKKSNSKKG